MDVLVKIVRKQGVSVLVKNVDSEEKAKEIATFDEDIINDIFYDASGEPYEITSVKEVDKDSEKYDNEIDASDFEDFDDDEEDFDDDEDFDDEEDFDDDEEDSCEVTFPSV